MPVKRKMPRRTMDVVEETRTTALKIMFVLPDNVRRSFHPSSFLSTVPIDWRAE